MRNNYYIFVIAHSIRGRIRRVHIPQYFMYACAVFAIIGFVTVMGAVGSYMRMLLKVTNYNHLRSESEALRQKYHNLRVTMSDTEVQLASLQNLASEVSVAYGIVPNNNAPSLWNDEPTPSSLEASKEQFQFLLKASYTPPTQRQFLFGARPSRVPLDWPVQGRLTGAFGDRLDPFNGEGAFHAGLDISCPYGMPVHSAGDGIVVMAARESGYGMTVVIDHGRGVRTLYAHLSGFSVSEGQEVLGGETIGFVGRSGRSTGPHLHYEIRLNNTPVNPVSYLRRLATAHIRSIGDD